MCRSEVGREKCFFKKLLAEGRDRDFACKNHDKLTRHNLILDAFLAACRLVGISADRTTVLSYMKERRPDGSIDPSERCASGRSTTSRLAMYSNEHTNTD
eukprot:SAG22_NODE_22_length_31438_cov_47.016529_12_plen_100_part_00